MSYMYEIWQGTSTNPTVESGSQSITAASGQPAAWSVPAGLLANDSDYEYRVQAVNGGDSSGWSPWYLFSTAAPEYTSLSQSIYSSASQDGALAAGQTRSIPVAGVGAAPTADDGDAAADLTVQVSPLTGAMSGSMQMSSSDVGEPPVTIGLNGSSISTRVSNQLLGSDGDITVTNQSSANVNFTITMNGWYQYFSDDLDSTGGTTDPGDDVDPGADADVLSQDLADAQADTPAVTVRDFSTDPSNNSAEAAAAAGTDGDSSTTTPSGDGTCQSSSSGSSMELCGASVAATQAQYQASLASASAAASSSEPSTYGNSANGAVTDNADNSDNVAMNGVMQPGAPTDLAHNCGGNPGVNILSRFHSCEYQSGTLKLRDDDGVVGTADVDIFDSSYTSSTDGGKFRTEFAIHVSHVTGELASDGLDLTPTVKCWSGHTSCGEHTDSTQEVSGEPWYKIEFKQSMPSVPYNQALYSHADIVLDFQDVVQPTAKDSYEYRSSVFRRTDNYSYLGGVGTVMDEALPTLTLHRNPAYGSPKSAAFIASAQRKLLGHPGRYPGDFPLSRLQGKSFISRNRSAACSGFKKKNKHDSCDEYPFASSYEGAYQGIRGQSFETKHVPAGDNSRAGSRLGAFYQNQRIADSDEYWVNITW